MKKLSFVKLIAIAILIPTLAGTVSAQKSVRLKYKLKTGDKYEYLTALDQDISFETNGQAVALNQVMNFNMTMEISESDQPETYKIISTIDRITMQQSVFGMEINYDSKDSSTFTSGMGKQIGDQMNKIIGKKFYTVIDSYGNIKSVDMSEISDNKDITDNINKSAEFAVFPDHKVAVGDSWETDVKPLNNSDMKVHTKYTLTKIKGKKAYISFESTISSAGGSEMNISGTQKGEMTVDTKTGWTTHSETDQELKIDIDQGGMSIPAEVSGTSETNSKKK